MQDLLTALGTVLMVWAHPDDETYLAGGLSAALTDAGRRVVCVTATRGEAGGTTAGLAQIRTAELEAALKLLGVEEHHWLDYPDGGCASVDDDKAAARIRAVVDDVRPDTVVTFGPDGFTGHPDHQAVSRWVDLAVSGTDVRVLHAVAREQRPDPGLDEDYGVFELGRPRVCADDEIDVLLPLDACTARPQGPSPAAAGVADGGAGRSGGAATLPRLGGDRGARGTGRHDVDPR